jgi:hypothetical protein
MALESPETEPVFYANYRIPEPFFFPRIESAGAVVFAFGPEIS